MPAAWPARKSCVKDGSAPSPGINVPLPSGGSIPSYIAVEGPIGVGKTSLTLKLAEVSGGRAILEKVDENPFLPGFYRDRDKYAFSAQMFFLLSRYRQLQEANQVDIFQRRVVADYLLEKDRLFASLNLDSDEFTLYNEMYGLLEPKLAHPGLVIFLSANTETLIRRIQKRGRKYENGISEKYIEEVNEAYHRWFFGYSPGPVLQVNTSEIDFVENEEDFRKLLEKISRPIQGKEFFNPLGSR